MKLQINQTLYVCSYCGKRLITKKGCALHEEQYCGEYDSPNQQRIRQFQKDCPHKNIDTKYSYIPGEAVKEPDYDFCMDCGLVEPEKFRE